MRSLEERWRKEPRRSPQEEVFLAEWRPRSLALGWRPAFEFRTRKRRVWVDWAEVRNERRLMRLSRVAERQYLARIGELRTTWVAQRKGALGEVGAQAEFERELCKVDLYYLTKYILGYEDMTFHLHKGYAEAQQGLGAGARELREGPRGSFKSTIWTIGWSVQQILRNPEVTILIISNSDPLASSKLEEIKNHFVNPRGRLCLLFPEMCCEKAAHRGSGSSWKVPCAKRATTEGTIDAAGVGTSRTGRHYDVILGDDFWNEKSVTNEEATTKVESARRKLFGLAKDQNKVIVVFVATRFAHDDPTESLLAGGYQGLIVSGVLPCGRPLFPERASLATYMGQLAENGVYDFSCQIMLNPTVGDMAFKREWFRYLRFAQIHAEAAAGRLDYRVVILTDAAVAGAASSDNIAIGAVVCDSLGRRTLVGYVRAKMAPNAFLEEVEKQSDRWNPVAVARQKTSLETAISAFAAENDRRRQKEGKEPIRWYDYSLHKREKKMRITASLQPRMASGQMFFDPDLPGLEELINEFLTHPNSRNDDGLDMLAMLDDPFLSKCPAPPAQAPKVLTAAEQMHALVTAGHRPREERDAEFARERRALAERYFVDPPKRRRR